MILSFHCSVFLKRKPTAKVALGPARPKKKKVVLGNTSRTLLFQVQNKVSLSIHHVCSDAGNAGIECADHVASPEHRG